MAVAVLVVLFEYFLAEVIVALASSWQFFWRYLLFAGVGGRGLSRWSSLLFVLFGEGCLESSFLHVFVEIIGLEQGIGDWKLVAGFAFGLISR